MNPYNTNPRGIGGISTRLYVVDPSSNASIYEVDPDTLQAVGVIEKPKEKTVQEMIDHISSELTEEKLSTIKEKMREKTVQGMIKQVNDDLEGV